MCVWGGGGQKTESVVCMCECGRPWRKKRGHELEMRAYSLCGPMLCSVALIAAPAGFGRERPVIPMPPATKGGCMGIGIR